MTTFLTYTVVGIVFSCVYALSASGLVVTYATSGVFNFGTAHGMLAAFVYWQLTVAWGWRCSRRCSSSCLSPHTVRGASSGCSCVASGPHRSRSTWW